MTGMAHACEAINRAPHSMRGEPRTSSGEEQETESSGDGAPQTRPFVPSEVEGR
jgi:hypothetical protein